MHPLWFCKHQHDNRVRSKLFVACQRWLFQWRFWFVPSVLGYLREEEEHKPDPWHNTIERNYKKSQVYCVWQVVKTLTIISNNPVVPNNMVSAVTGYYAVGVFSFHKCTPVRSIYNSWSGIMCYTTVKVALWQKLEFSKHALSRDHCPLQVITRS